MVWPTSSTQKVTATPPLAVATVSRVTVPSAAVVPERVSEKEPWLFRKAKEIYEPLLKRAMGRPRRTFVGAIGVFLASLLIVPFLGAEFIPRLDEGAIAMQVWRLPSVSLEASNEISAKAERVVKAFPEVETVVSRTGRAEGNATSLWSRCQRGMGCRRGPCPRTDKGSSY